MFGIQTVLCTFFMKSKNYRLFPYCYQCTTSGNLSGRVNNTDKQGLLIIIIIYFITVTSVQPLATSPEESTTQISRDC